MATQEAQTRGWDLNVMKDLMQRMLKSARSTLLDADRELKAAHHATRVEDLAYEASEVLNGTKWRSRQDCMGFREELVWELPAFSKVNTKLELSQMPTDRRPAARLLAKRVDAGAHHARQVMERVLWDYDCVVPTEGGQDGFQWMAGKSQDQVDRR